VTTRGVSGHHRLVRCVLLAALALTTACSANGAYGAGVLSGWSELGNRPEFTLVTGISTGALTAPFAFLGSDYDEQLKTLYTTLDTSRIFSAGAFFRSCGVIPSSTARPWPVCSTNTSTRRWSQSSHTNIGDTYRITALANRDGIDVKLTWISASAIRDPENEVFDPDYMSALFDYGYRRTLEGDAWRDIAIDQLGSFRVE
jgi:hypothetical protein